MSSKNEEKIFNQFIDELNRDTKPSIYQTGEEMDPELEKAFETVRAVKRLRHHSLSRRWLKSSWLKGAAAAAAAVLLVIGLSLFNLTGLPGQETGIVHAVVKAYEELESYKGTAEIRSEKNGEVDFRETIDIAYQKPASYKAVHRFDGHEIRHVSDGDSLVRFAPYGIEVENIFPEKELWRYHIGTAVWELDEASEVNILGTETLFGREATVIEYRFTEKEEFNQLWIDESLMLPLRKILNSPEGSLTVEFKELEINPELDENIFEWELPPDAEAETLNRTGTMEEAGKLWPEWDHALDAVPDDMELDKIGILEDNLFFELVLRFTGPEKRDFLDLYRSSSPREFIFFSGSELGRLKEGYVELNPEAWNVFELYTGKTRIGRWVTIKETEGQKMLDEEVFLVSSRSTEELHSVLEQLAGAEIQPIDLKELLEKGLEPAAKKEGH